MVASSFIEVGGAEITQLNSTLMVLQVPFFIPCLFTCLRIYVFTPRARQALAMAAWYV